MVATETGVKAPTRSPYAGAGAGEELYGELSSADVAKRALGVFALALCTALLGLDPATFAQLYALDVGARMLLIGSVSFTRFYRSKGDSRASDPYWAAALLAPLWLLLVWLPVTVAWGHLGDPAAGVDRLRGVVLAAVVLGLAVRAARHEARQPERPGPTLFKPVLGRALRITAFVFFGPGVFAFARAMGCDESASLALGYAVSECFPPAATLIDRALHRFGRGRRDAQAQVRHPRTP